MARRYGRAQFLKDAIRFGLTPETAFSRAELRRHRDRLIVVHHPDRGGTAEKAARINSTYARMLRWLDDRDAKAAETVEPRPSENGKGDARTIKLAKVWGAAIAAVAAYVAVRRRRGP